MASAFPGMDPYLETPAIWSGVHVAFLGAILEKLGPAVRPKYAVRIEERVYLSDETDAGWDQVVPDVRVVARDATSPHQSSCGLAIAKPIREVEPRVEEVHDRFIQVLDLSDRSVVTAIEFLSPANKVPNSRGRREFLAKKHELLCSDTHWMEIDVLRAGERSPIPGGKKAAYMVYVSRAISDERRERLTWPVSIRERLPVVGVPLRGSDNDVPLDLQAVLEAVIERGSYDLDFDYTKPPTIPLTGEDAEWARALLAAGARPQAPSSADSSQ